MQTDAGARRRPACSPACLRIRLLAAICNLQLVDAQSIVEQTSGANLALITFPPRHVRPAVAQLRAAVSTIHLQLDECARCTV